MLVSSGIHSEVYGPDSLSWGRDISSAEHLVSTHLCGQNHLLLTKESVGPELFTEEAKRSVVLALVRKVFQALAAVFKTWTIVSW